MILPDGVTVYVGGAKYTGEIPDNKVPAKLNKAKLSKRLKEQEESKKPASKKKAD